MTKQFFTIILITVLFLTACPSVSTIDKAIKAVSKIDSVTMTAKQAALLSFNDGLITEAQRDLLLPKFELMTKGASAFQNAAKALKSQYQGNIPPDNLKALVKLLEADVVAPFLEILSELKLIKNSVKILTALSIIHLSLVSILEALERNETVSVINRQFKEAERSA